MKIPQRKTIKSRASQPIYLKISFLALPLLFQKIPSKLTEKSVNSFIPILAFGRFLQNGNHSYRMNSLPSNAEAIPLHSNPFLSLVENIAIAFLTRTDTEESHQPLKNILQDPSGKVPVVDPLPPLEKKKRTTIQNEHDWEGGMINQNGGW